MKIFTALIMIYPLWANAFTVECPGQTPHHSFKVESQESIMRNAFGAFSFPKNTIVNVTETVDGFNRHFTGSIIFQNVGTVVKHGRMAQYIFSLSGPNKTTTRLLGGNKFSLIMSVNGIDDFENPLECFWP